MTDEQRANIFDDLMAKIMANNIPSLEKYVEVENALLSMREQNSEAIDIAIECVEYFNRIVHYGWSTEPIGY